MSKVINIAVKTVYQGKIYDAITIYPGVSFSFEPLPCVADKTRLVFLGTSVKPNVFVEDVSSVEECEVACDPYSSLQIVNDI
jgi:hypothetical protein